MGYLLGTSLLFVAVAIAGHCAVRHKSLALLMVYVFLSAGLLVACSGGVYYTFYNSQALAGWVQSMDDRTLGPVATSLGMGGNKASILSSLQSNMHMIGLACGVVLLLQVVSLLCAAYFGCAARAWQLQFGLVVRVAGAPKGSSRKHRQGGSV